MHNEDACLVAVQQTMVESASLAVEVQLQEEQLESCEWTA